MRRGVVFLLVGLLAAPAIARAQAEQSPAEKRDSKKDDVAPAVDATKMGVSLSRIKRELAQAEAEATVVEDGRLRFSFSVDVVGQAPKINFLEGFSLNGATPYGAPTHGEILDVLTPQAYKSPPIPFSAMAVWAAKYMWDKSKKSRCEQELAEYKALVMQGVAVAAPRCTQ
jgi:hypothetical protein